MQVARRGWIMGQDGPWKAADEMVWSCPADRPMGGIKAGWRFPRHVRPSGVHSHAIRPQLALTQQPYWTTLQDRLPQETHREQAIMGHVKTIIYDYWLLDLFNKNKMIFISQTKIKIGEVLE